MDNNIVKKLVLGLVFPTMFSLNVNASEAFFNFCCKGQIESVEGFIAKDKELVNAKDENGFTPLIIASRQGDLKLVKLLVENGAKLEVKDNCGFTALIRACENGHWQVAEYLINRNADVNAQNNDGMSPLMYGCMYGYNHVVSCLLNSSKNKIKTNIKDKLGRTALDFIFGHNYKGKDNEWMTIISFFVGSAKELLIENGYEKLEQFLTTSRMYNDKKFRVTGVRSIEKFNK